MIFDFLIFFLCLQTKTEELEGKATQTEERLKKAEKERNDGERAVRMLLVENSRLLAALGLNERESAGEISYAEHREGR